MVNKNVFDVTVVGSCVVDFICYSSRLPQAGETLHGTRFCKGFGGKGANQCVAASRLGSRTAMVGKLGDDSWGNDYKYHLLEEQINVDHVTTIKNQKTGIAQIIVADNGENQIVIVAGVNNLLSVKDIENADSVIVNSKVLVCQLETPTAATIASLQRFSGISIMNAAPALVNTPIELMTLATILCVNETEASLMTKHTVVTIDDACAALRKLLDMGCNVVIITLGDAGAIFSSRCDRKIVHVTVEKVAKVVDTTGAGDAFIGALAHFTASHPDSPLDQRIAVACHLASASVQLAGTQTSFSRGPYDFGMLLQQLNNYSTTIKEN